MGKKSAAVPDRKRLKPGEPTDLAPNASVRVRSLSIFGSLARDEARKGSDVDLLVEFSQPVGIFEFIRLKHFLEEILGATVDLATPEALKKQLRERILKEAVRAA